MLRFLRKIRHRDFLLNVSFLMAGTTVANLMGVISAPILSRIFTPQNFGEFALFAAIMRIFSTTGSLSYERSIVVSDNHKTSFHLTYLCFTLITIIFIATMLPLIVWREQLSSALGLAGLRTWILLLPMVY